jgi:hypothetical protein
VSGRERRGEIARARAPGLASRDCRVCRFAARRLTRCPLEMPVFSRLTEKSVRMRPGLDRSPRARKAVVLHDVARAPKTRRIISMSTPPEYAARITPARARPIPGVHGFLHRCAVLASPSCSLPMNLPLTHQTCGNPSAPVLDPRPPKMDGSIFLHSLFPTCSTCTFHRSDDEEWKVRIIKDTRVERGQREWLVAWAGADDKGDAWDHSWEPTANVSYDLIHDFNTDVAGRVQRAVSVDVRPLDSMVSRTIAQAIMADRSASFGAVHCTAIDALSLRDLAVYFLERV